MAERLRALLERPLDPAACRAVVALACAITVGFAAVVILGSGGGDPRPSTSAPSPGAGRSIRVAESRRSVAPEPTGVDSGRSRPHQDPQDQPGSGAQLRAGRELATHRALQHVPFRAAGIVIDLVGARGHRAVLAVRAATLAAAHRGWRAFLRRFHDIGRAYLPRFETRGGRRG